MNKNKCIIDKRSNLSNYLPSIFGDRWINSYITNFLDTADYVFEQSSPKAYPYDVISTKNENGDVSGYIITVALAGVGKENINIYTEKQCLTIDVLKHQKGEDEKQKVERNGISKRSETFSFAMSDSVDVKNITSKYNDGLLEVFVPLKSHEDNRITFKID
jgi:HSP20 family molecular chaperone IbpA